MIYLDTHVAVWLATDEIQRLSAAARQAIEADDAPRLSPMVVLEFGYLQEIGRIACAGSEIIARLEAGIGLRVCDLSWPAICQQALALTWTRDPFDRLITAHAMLAKASLVTHDGSIRANYAKAVW